MERGEAVDVRPARAVRTAALPQIDSRSSVQSTDEPADLGEMRGRSARRAEVQPDPAGLTARVFRLAILALALAIGAVRSELPGVAVVIALLAIPDVVLRKKLLSTTATVRLAAYWCIVGAVGVVFTGGATSSLFPAIAVAMFMAGSALGAYAVVVVSGLASAILVVAWLVRHENLHGGTNYFVTSAQWVVLALAVGLGTTWATRRVQPETAVATHRYAEARALLEELRTVATRLPGSLDLATTCEVLLERALGGCHATKGAVLVHVGDGYLVPIAVRGTRRVPWRSPLVGPGPMQQAWETGRPALDVRPPDRDGRRAGSALLVVPLLAPDGVIGLVALEGGDASSFGGNAVDEVASVVDSYVIQVETAQLFEEVRGQVMLEERHRLAREMHDGVAQDLAYIGFELDALRTRAARVDAELATSVAEVRAQTTRIIGDIRASISDLRSSMSVDRGLGSALASYVRNIGATGRLTVHLSLQESAFRLPAEVEVLLFRIAQELTTVAREEAGAHNLWVSLSVDPPTAMMRIEHDGEFPLALHDVEATRQRLTALGGALTIHQRQPSGVTVVAMIGGTGDDDPAAAR